MTPHQLKAQRQAWGFVSPVSVQASTLSVSTKSMISFLSLSSDTCTQLPKTAVGLPSPGRASHAPAQPPAIAVELGTCTALRPRPHPPPPAPGPATGGPGVMTMISLRMAWSQSLGAPHMTPPDIPTGLEALSLSLSME